MKNKTEHHFPPFQMKRNTAAYYCGMSITSFDKAVAAGELPRGVKKIGGVYWLRQELENALLEQVENANKVNFDTPI